MAFGYWKTGWEEKEAVFNLTFRNNPFGGGFSIACGLASVIEYLDRYAFSAGDIDYLGKLTGNDGRPIFQSDFLSYLGRAEADLRDRRFSRRGVGLPSRARAACTRADHLMPAPGNNPAEYPQLSIPDCHQGGPGVSGSRRRSRAGIRSSAGAGKRWRPYGKPGRLYWRLRRHIQPSGREALWNPGSGNSCPQLGHGLWRRA